MSMASPIKTRTLAELERDKILLEIALENKRQLESS